MPLESSTNIEELDQTYPLGGDPVAVGAAHIRNIKSALKLQFPGAGGNGFSVVISATEDELDTLVGTTSPIQAQINEIQNLGAMPVSGIVLYEGTQANIPANYQFCDGTNGTPDMRNRFVVGTNVNADIGNIGGVADAVVVAHSHTFNHSHSTTITDGGAHTHPQGGGTPDGTSSSSTIPEIYAAAPFVTVQTDVNGSHSHVITAGWSSTATTTVGVSATNRNLPAYYKLSFIMRVS